MEVSLNTLALMLCAVASAQDNEQLRGVIEALMKQDDGAVKAAVLERIFEELMGVPLE